MLKIIYKTILSHTISFVSSNIAKILFIKIKKDMGKISQNNITNQYLASPSTKFDKFGIRDNTHIKNVNLFRIESLWTQFIFKKSSNIQNSI